MTCDSRHLPLFNGPNLDFKRTSIRGQTVRYIYKIPTSSRGFLRAIFAFLFPVFLSAQQDILLRATTVMGPGKDFEKGLVIMHPPVFEQDQDLFIFDFFFESKQFIYSVRNVHSRETEQHYLNIVM